MLRKLLAGTGCAMTVAGLATGGAWASRDVPPVEDTCAEVLRGAPTGAVHKSTDPPDGTWIEAGQVVAVRITWSPATFAGRSVHKVLDCVSVDGEPVPELSLEAQPAPNDGASSLSFGVPGDLALGSEVCDRGFVSGPGADGGFRREKSNDVCFTVASPERTGTEPRRPAFHDNAPPPAPDVVRAAVEVPPPPPAQTPAPAVAEPAPPPARLPRTGDGARPLALVAGTQLVLGGLAVMAGARSRRRPTGWNG